MPGSLLPPDGSHTGHRGDRAGGGRDGDPLPDADLYPRRRGHHRGQGPVDSRSHDTLSNRDAGPDGHCDADQHAHANTDQYTHCDADQHAPRQYRPTPPTATPTNTPTPIPTNTPTPTPTSTPTATPDTAQSMADIVERSRTGVVLIAGTSGSGTGFVVDPVGYILTNEHVIARGRPLTVVLDDGTR